MDVKCLSPEILSQTQTSFTYFEVKIKNMKVGGVLESSSKKALIPGK